MGPLRPQGQCYRSELKSADVPGLMGHRLLLSGNSMANCIPPVMREVAPYDLDGISLPDCAG